MLWWNYHSFERTRSDTELWKVMSMCRDKYISMLPCTAVADVDMGITKSFYGLMGSFWLSSQKNTPRASHNTAEENKDTGLERWVTAWKYSVIVFFFLKYLPVHSLSHAAVGIPTRNTLRWLWAAHSSLKQLSLFPRALQVIFPGSLQLQSCTQ